MLKYIYQWNDSDKCGLLVGVVGKSTIREGNSSFPLAMAGHGIPPLQLCIDKVLPWYRKWLLVNTNPITVFNFGFPAPRRMR